MLTSTSLSGAWNLKLGQKLMPILHLPNTCMRTCGAGHSFYHGALFSCRQGTVHGSVCAASGIVDSSIVTCVIWLKGIVVPRTLCTTSAAICTPAAGGVTRGGTAAVIG